MRFRGLFLLAALAMAVPVVNGQQADDAGAGGVGAPAEPAAKAAPAATDVPALKKRYRALRARRDALEDEIADLEDQATTTRSDDGADDQAPATKPPRAVNRRSGGTAAGTAPSDGDTGGGAGGEVKHPRAAEPAGERLARMRERLRILDDQITAVEKEAAELGLGSAGLMQGRVE